MPQKKAQALPKCWSCGEGKKETEMASWSGKGWRCNGCYNAELSFLRETRRAEEEMRKVARDYFYSKEKRGFVKEYAQKFKRWNWDYFWDQIDQIRKEEAFLKEASLKRVDEEDYAPWLEEEPINWEELPPLEYVRWSDVPF